MPRITINDVKELVDNTSIKIEDLEKGHIQNRKDLCYLARILYLRDRRLAKLKPYKTYGGWRHKRR